MAQLKSTLVKGNLAVTGDIVANSFIKNGGRETDLLRADGSAAALTRTEVINSLGYTPLESYTDTNTTYTFANGTNQFTVTPSGGTAQTVKITPSITVTATGSGTGPIVSNITSGTNGITFERVSLETLGLGTVYEYKGSCTWQELLAITSAQVGDVYNVTDKDPNGVTGANWACYKTVTAATTASTYATYWDTIGGVTDLSAYVTLSGTQTISGNKTLSGSNTFSKQIKSTLANGTAPFAVTSKTLNTNLNADLLDGYEGSYYLNYNNLGNKPTIPDPTDYYWANIKVGNSSNLNTAPTFAPTFKVNLAQNGVYSAGGDYAYSSPMSKYYWHDLLSFNANNGTPTVEVTANGTTWTEYQDVKYTHQPFIQRENQAISIISDTQTGIRWTWYSTQFHACQANWVLIGATYSAKAATCQCTIEHSEDQVTWITSHTSSITLNQAPYWLYLNSPSWNKHYYFRITILRTSGAGTAVGISGIKLLTGRWGNQGAGSELESPYDWNYNQDIYPRTNKKSNLGSSDRHWLTVYAENVAATNLSGDGSSITNLNAEKITSGTISSDRLPTIPENLMPVKYAKKEQGIYFVVGNTTGTEGVWTGSNEDITEYYDGLVINYKIGIKGAATTTLNINNLGAKTCYLRGTSKLTTHYAIGTMVLLSYNAATGAFYAADYDSNSDTKMTQAYRTTNENRPLLMSAGYTSSSTSGSSATTSYWNPSIYGNPSTGALYATSVYATTLYEGTTALSAKYLGISAKAADSDKLDGEDSAFYRNANNINAGTLPITRGGTSATSQAQINKNIVGGLSEGNSDVTDGTMIITSYASDSGFADTNAVNVPYKRKASKFYNYIKDKTDALYLPLTGGTLSGNLTLMPSNQHNDDVFINFKYSTTDLDDYSWRLGYLGTGSGNANYFVIQSNGASDTWVSVMQLGLSSYDATFRGSLTAASLNTAGTITGNGASITNLNASNIASGTLGAARLPTSGVTKGTYGTAQTPSHGGTFAIPQFTVDEYGRITSVGSVNITLPADSNTDTKVTQNKVTDAVWRKVLLSYNSGTAIDSTPSNATNVSYWAAGIEVQPSTGVIKTEGYNIGGDALMSYDSTNACIRFTFN